MTNRRSTLGRATLALAAAALLSLGLVTAQPATARAAVINLNIGADATPNFVVVSGTRVYHTTDLNYDVYRYGGRYYIYDNGTWYRASSVRGSFRPTVVVPRSIMRASGHVSTKANGRVRHRAVIKHHVSYD